MTGENGAEPIDVGPLFSLAEIARKLNISYERLRGFADAAGEELGGVRGQGKGLKYPYASIERFRALLAAHERGEVTPATAAAWLKRFNEAHRSGNRAIVPIAHEPVEPVRLNLDDLAMAIGQGIQEGIRPLIAYREQGETLSGVIAG